MHAIIESARLLLRRLRADDATFLHELDSDPEVMRWLNGGKPNYPRFTVA